MTISVPKDRRFIFEIPFFINYMGSNKLFFLIAALSAASILEMIPIPFWGTLVSILLFLTIYKLAFEVMLDVADGHFSYEDKYDAGVSDFIGFKALALPGIQILIIMFVMPNNWVLALALLAVTLFLSPAFMMLLSQTDDVFAAMNPIQWVEIVKRLGLDYWLMIFFMLLIGVLNGVVSYALSGLLPNWLESIIMSFTMNYTVILSFLIMGYIMYYHSHELDHTPHDVEDTSSSANYDDNDPIKRRIEDLIESGENQTALNIIKEMKQEGRDDLDALAHQAQNRLTVNSRQSPKEKLSTLIEQKKLADAVKLWKTYHQDGHTLRPDDVQHMEQLIQYSNDKNQFALVFQMVKGIDKAYPTEHQFIVDQLFLSAKILYQNKKVPQAGKLMQSIVTKYSEKANTNAVSSYLKGLKKMGKI